MDYMTEDYTQSYTSFKAELDMELNKAADGFVKIGYLLKVARDTDVLGSSGYKTVAEFAQVEYGLTKDVVSRYMAINDRYSEGGYAPVLASKYHNFGLAKLAEMLTLPDNIVAAIPEDMTKEEIREIKKEYAEEQKTSDIELFEEKAEIEAEEKNREDLDINDTVPDNPMKHIIHDFLKENPDEYLKFKDFMLTGKDAYEILAPSGSRIITSRIPGQGRFILSLTGPEEPVSVVSMRNPDESYKYTLDEIADYISLFIPSEGDVEVHKGLYEKIFNTEWPIKDAPEKSDEKESENGINTRKKSASDIKDTEKKPEKKKQSKVTVVKPKVEVVPGVEAEIEDINKASEAAEKEELKAVIEAVPSHTNEEPETESEKEPENGLITQSEEEYEEVAPAQPNQYQNMPTEELEKIFGEIYNDMDEQWQMAKRYLRQYVKKPAEQAVQNAIDLFEKIKVVADELSVREEEED